LIAGSEVHQDLFMHNPWGVLLTYMVMNLFLFLMMSQVFIAIILCGFEAADGREVIRERNLGLPCGYELACIPALRTARHRVLSACHFPIYLLSMYDVFYGVVGFRLLHAICKVVAADERNRAQTQSHEHPQVLVTMSTLEDVLRADFGPKAHRCAKRLLHAHGVLTCAARAEDEQGRARKDEKGALDVTLEEKVDQLLGALADIKDELRDARVKTDIKDEFDARVTARMARIRAQTALEQGEPTEPPCSDDHTCQQRGASTPAPTRSADPKIEQLAMATQREPSATASSATSDVRIVEASKSSIADLPPPKHQGQPLQRKALSFQLMGTLRLRRQADRYLDSSEV